MKKWMIMIGLFLSGCYQMDLGMQEKEEMIHPANTYDEVAPHFEEIEALLTQVELEVGLGNLTIASSIFRELMAVVYGHEVATHQQARINTMSELLSDVLASNDEERIFSGSDAAAKVINLIGVAPVGYTFVYHTIPSFVGSNELGYYVFLVPENHIQTDVTEIKETFFVTERGEILTFE